MECENPMADDSHEGGGKNDKDDKSTTPLHEDFFPGDNDVICGRGKKCYAHTGNERFRKIVQSYLDRYSAASSRPEKSEILSAIVTEVRQKSPDGGFVKQDNDGKWFEVGDFLAREKTSQAFRDALHESYRSSKKSKHEKRRARTKAKTKDFSGKSPLSKAAFGARHGNWAIADSNFYPPLDATPLVRRQHLTTLREEEPPPHPHMRAYSFAGTSQEGRQLREEPARAMSLSSGFTGGRSTDRSDLPHAFGEQFRSYHRADSAPPRYGDPDISLGGFASFRDDEERMHQMHESWPEPYGAPSNSGRESTSYFHDSAPQFYPVHDEDVDAHTKRPSFLGRGIDPPMSEMESVRPRSVLSSRVDPYYSNSDTATNTRPKTRESDHSQPERLLAPPPLGALPASSSESEGHHRTDSTASSSAIVAQLESALPAEPHALEDNALDFEPIPLGGKPKKARTEELGDLKW